jgi:hypothetical protein
VFKRQGERTSGKGENKVLNPVVEKQITNCIVDIKSKSHVQHVGMSASKNNVRLLLQKSTAPETSMLDGYPVNLIKVTANPAKTNPQKQQDVTN